MLVVGSGAWLSACTIPLLNPYTMAGTGTLDIHAAWRGGVCLPHPQLGFSFPPTAGLCKVLCDSVLFDPPIRESRPSKHVYVHCAFKLM